MAKKVKKRKTSKRKIVREANAISRASRQLAIARDMPREYRRKILIKNLILFAALFVLSIIVSGSTNDEVVQQSFSILAILTGFVAIAILIALLVILFLGRKANKVR